MTRARWLVVIALVAAAAVVVYKVRPREGQRRAKAPPAAPAASATPPSASASPEAPAPGPTAARVRGKVLDAAGKAIPGAVVRFAQPASRRVTGEPSVTQSGAGGEYQLADLPPGKWSASASAPGYLPGHAEDLVLRPGEEQSVDLRLEPGGRVLRGTVTDRTGGAIAGALVEASPALGLLPAGTGRAAAALSARDGSYTLSLGEGRYRVLAAHPDYVREARAVELASAGATVDFALLPAGAIEGTVRELGSGAPVPGAIVAHEREAVAGGFLGDSMPVVGRRAGAVVADAEGRFRITGLEPGGIRLEGRAPGKGSKDKTVVSLGVAEQVSGIEIFLGAALAIRGKVIYDDGTPLPGAEVEVFGPAGSASTTADDNGRFALEGMTPNTWNLIASGGDGLAAGDRQRVVLRDKDAEVTLTLKRGVSVTGRVEPPGPALVRQKIEPSATPPRGGMFTRIVGRNTTARMDGSFNLGPVEPGTLRLEARAADGRRGEATIEVPADGARDVVIKLEERGGIAGKVVDESGKPLAGMVVNIARVDGGGDSGTTVIVNGLDVLSTRAPTAPNGAFAALGLEAGDYELTVTDDSGGRVALARGAAPPRVKLDADEHKTGIEIVVERRDGRLSGTVLDPEGKPLADAYVLAATPRLELIPPPRAPGGRPGTSMRRVIAFADDADDLGGATPPVLTDAAGKFEITGLRRGKYRLLGEGLSGKARGQLPEVMTGTEVTLKLDLLTRLDGKVTAGGKPVQQFTVELMGTTARSQTFRDAGGAFTLDRVDPGKYTVKVVAPEGNGSVETVIQPNQAATVTLALESHARVLGKVQRADGTPLAGSPVLFAPRRTDGQIRIEMTGDTPTTSADGSFDVEVAAGRHMLLVLGDGPMPAIRKEIEVTVGQMMDLGTLKVEPPPPPVPAPQQKGSLVQAAP